jgi:hypothetical protein
MRFPSLIRAVAAILGMVAVCGAAAGQNPRQEPAADLAAQIASILGHGTARLMIRNLSSLPVDAIPDIRKLLEQELRAHGIVANSAPNDTVIRVTLSESARGYTWVAEVVQGDDTQIAVADLPFSESSQTPAPVQLMLRREALITTSEQVLDALELESAMILLTPAEIDMETHSQAGWTKAQTTPIPARRLLARDPRGMLLPAVQGSGFEAWMAGSRCTGSPAQAPAAGWSIDCHASDDPWPLAAATVAIAARASSPISNPPPSPPLPPAQSAAVGSATGGSAQGTNVVEFVPIPSSAPALNAQIRAFYNVARDYFTGVVSPSMGVDLPPFYSAAVLPRASGTTLLINTIDGKILLVANSKLTAVSGTSDWGSDFAVIHSGCSDGAQIIVSGAGNSISGNPPTDWLRAFRITGSGAEPVSSILAIDGSVTALWSAPDDKGVFAVIRNPQNQYEVDRVTALCN